MKYQGRKTKIVIAMITISLAGLMAVQLLLLGIAWELKDQAFERNVITALTVSAQKLEVGEITKNAMEVIYKFDLSDSLHSGMRHFEFHSPDVPPFPEAMSVIAIDSLRATRQLTVVMAEGRTQLIQRIVDDLVVQKPRPIEERLNGTRLDSLLRANLDAVGIDLVPQYQVFSARNDSLVLASAKATQETDKAKFRDSKFRSQLFPLDFTSEGFEIVLHFPGQRSFLFKQIWPLLAASIIFIAVIIAAFVMVLAAGNQQRRFASRIVDFINNMTHEFKTPISTVALASEAIARKDIMDHPEALDRYNRMIRDENQRMRQQVERILQIAQLETGDFQLNLASVNIHDLIRSSADNFALQLEKRGGTLSLDLEAGQTFVHGDPVHLANVLANLLDNAIKYSPETPVIHLATSNKTGRIIIEVTDEGIGIERADHEQVFEKYYRCPTGDRHDVKGFGLGLSYVRLLVDAHGGGVKLHSVHGKGTRVVLRLPLDQNTSQNGSAK